MVVIETGTQTLQFLYDQSKAPLFSNQIILLMQLIHGAAAAVLVDLNPGVATLTLELVAPFTAEPAADRRRHIPPAGQVFSVGMGALEIQARMLRLGQHLLVVAEAAVIPSTPVLAHAVRSSSLYSQLNR